MAKHFMRVFLIIIFMSASYGNACELTEDYKSLRSEAYKTIHSSYKACRKSTKEAEYWRSFVKCVEEYGVDSGSRCHHVDAINDSNKDEMLGHCEKLKPTREQAFGYFNDLVEEKGVEKCTQKTEQSGNTKSDIYE